MRLRWVRIDGLRYFFLFGWQYDPHLDGLTIHFGFWELLVWREK